jgi:hypothetical protein
VTGRSGADIPFMHNQINAWFRPVVFQTLIVREQVARRICLRQQQAFPLNPEDIR